MNTFFLYKISFISIDCGIEKDRFYYDDSTGIPYTSDAQFIDSGVNNNISQDYITNSLPAQLLSLRSFPSGSRNCYTLSVSSGVKYLLRASFLYGNYDGLNNAEPDNPMLFDLVLGVNLWKTINISDASIIYTAEALTVAEFDLISVCLVDTNSGTPFISLLELRALKTSLYPAVNASSSLVLCRRLNVGSSKNQLHRYPEDPYDRLWEPYTYSPYWTSISTTFNVENPPKDVFEVPSSVLQTAVMPTNATSLKFYWDAIRERDGTFSQYHLFMHFAEIQSNASNRTSIFNVHLNGDLWDGPFAPNYLSSGHIYTTTPGSLYQYNISINQANTSVLPPILNAVEIYSLIKLKELATDFRDIVAIMAIKAHFQIKRNWMGDPCAPRNFVWEGLICSYSIYAPPRITTLNLSSSGLTGEIPATLANLSEIKYLDLSYNNLTGEIPDFLAKLTSLQLLILTGNQLNGSIPPALLGRSTDGPLILSIEDNSPPCDVENSCNNKKNIAPLREIFLATALLLSLLIVFYLLRMRKKEKAELVSDTIVKLQKEGSQKAPIQSESRQFTYGELENITNNFELQIGKGGFGTVFHGYLDGGTQVAVKMRSQTSSQGSKEFMCEAQLLTRVHHRNLVPLIGYCNDDHYLALVYEYMSEGSLEDHMRGKTDSTRVIGWEERLRIAIEAAQGLEYLHKGCKPPVIHRDVKTSNILLSEKLEAKLADFGLSKSFHESLTHVSTAVVGTVGYLDPEYYSTFKLSEKSDVYSFGVVLLELITGQRAVLPRPEKCHISHWMRQRLANGNISDFVDTRMQEVYDVNSIWKVADLAMKCTAATSSRRPNMAYVVARLKEALAMEASSQDRSYEMSVQASESSESETSDVARGGRINRVGGPAGR
ncbi:probable LRR receptor-like serine/threonine-protein kinase At1g05700 isoform X2 [Asparagus officinalis]|uniref:probable LRR receptor-like serine/threonine-protein kinase At1g05700 isoform X2 n=1 Tax=Asparagus officinalis TaxID=4686 RepID=UPI00098E42F8|nr:probable LRR receptor-like serine/threonine-protein kinase At1g05700 isoform X2 [Asparagus officinalis]